MRRLILQYTGIVSLMLFSACSEDERPPPSLENAWSRVSPTPVFRDPIPDENYQVASDAHVFFDATGTLQMIYTGDIDGKPAIKLAQGTAWDAWTPTGALLGQVGPSGVDRNKETGFYRRASDGSHQIYYIGYDDEATYEAQIYLAEADALEGPYTQRAQPVVPKGTIAGEDVYCMTSPSVVEHQGLLYLMFIGWDAAPHEVTEVWVIGATSSDEGRTWSDFQRVDTRIGMEGQVTKTPDGTFVAVRTGEYQGGEAVFYATATHPFGPWTEAEAPILVQEGPPYEKDEIIAPQITIDPSTDRQYLYYTGADHQTGWWIMLAEKK